MAPGHRTWTWEWWFDAPPARLWPFVRDTNRLDRLAGLAPATYAPAAGRPAGTLAVRQRVMGFLPTAYEEAPYEWVEGEGYSVDRTYSKGPVAESTLATRLVPDDRGTRVVTTLRLRPRGRFAALFLSRAVRAAKRGLDRAYERVRADVLGEEAPPSARPALARRVRARLDAARPPVAPDLAARLATHLAVADAADLARVRPFALADRWKAPRAEVLAACLSAVRAGVLELSWESLCPHCRGAKRAVASLRDVRSSATCDACRVEFEVELDRTLEACFRPAPDLRRVDDGLYCLGGPGFSPHVVARTRVPASGATSVAIALRPGAHLVRGIVGAGGALLPVSADPASAGGDAAVEIEAQGVRVVGGPVREGRVRVRFANRTTEEVAVSVERMEWLADVATALDVLAVPGFRDLFASEVLAPGERVAVRRVAILFTDLRGSTALYRRVGDAAAYALVRDHFAAVRRAVGEHGGAIVKTIGDSVMASFRSASDALRAALDLQRCVAALPRPAGEPPLVLKAGLHRGPSIAVNSGGVVDFFGTTANLAARAQHESLGGDVVATEEALGDDDVAEALAAVPHRREAFAASLKGFDEPVALARLTFERRS
jgi:class 3 adenylate cyclase